MDLQPQAYEKIKQLLARGVDIPNPATLDIGDEVNIDQIAEKGVKIYPGCRIYGAKTVISPGCKLGYEGPVTIDNCQLGEKVELKGGFFSKSVFLEKANMGLGGHVREGSILEEEAGGAHCVGLKQTILFPFVTLGSLINFCDCLMAGGTSRSNHSEVGSSYIHFNFTPDADKSTPSLLGDVPRGVMLKEPPIFLGGQGGIIGPVRLGYGNVVAAGSVLRQNYTGDGRLIFTAAPADSVRDFVTAHYPGLRRIVENNILYLANLAALEAWYANVRRPFLEARPFGSLLYAGALEQIGAARKERIKRLKAMAQKAAAAGRERAFAAAEARQELHDRMDYLAGLFSGQLPDEPPNVRMSCDAFLAAFEKAAGNRQAAYIETIQSLPADVTFKGSSWLNTLVDAFCDRAQKALPALGVFGN
ncbi:MAG: UDP-N-acetylglucosamine pyrophosphorylase [Deltaproteobacteria bacterium]|jgi:UDP-N-acetylglucosamine/UDP-N-acetylgalactosamine diphosphorylase|nr:UDP-N-acetylglucosamine pyrophosphorylase [Syntrophaceae bacterium]